jgi:pyocin large subunit-like protein
MSNKQNKLSPEKLRLILIGVIIVILAVLVATGKIDLNTLLGLEEAPVQTGQNIPDETPAPSQAASAAPTEKPTEKETAAYVQYKFRNKTLLNQHYDKHGKDMGFKNAQEYEKAASDVINNPNALRKTEKEDGDFVYYIRETNEFVVLSTDGYIRTYFLPDSGYSYYQRQ